MHIVILMSSFNGEMFIREQIDSILSQRLDEDTTIELIVRDDGSTDKTTEILEEYSRGGVLQWYQGDRLGAAGSFWELISKAPDADYYAFSDQDDVWFEDKILAAVEQLNLHDAERPLLYIGSLIPTDTYLNPLSEAKEEGIQVLEKPLVDVMLHSFGAGCTMVFNSTSREKYIKYPSDFVCAMHDGSAAKITAISGIVIIDRSPHMYYRQHGKNLMGYRKSGLINILFRIKLNFWGYMKGKRSKEADNILKVYGEDLTVDQKAFIKALAYYKHSKKEKKYLESQINNNKKLSNVIYRLMILTKSL